MPRFRSMTILGTMALVATLVPLGSARAADQDQPHAARRALVGARAGEHGRAEEAIAAHGGRIISYYEPGDFFIVETPGHAPDWARQVRNDDAIRYAELDYELSLEARVPNDPRFGQLYGMQRIQAPTAWDTSTGSESVVVGVIDTGVDYKHQDLAGNMWINSGEIPGNGIDDDQNGYRDDVYGADCANNDGDPMDDHGHGTHVAGTIGAVGNNLTGVVGVNWNVSIMALKFLRADGFGSTTDAIECIDYAIANGAHLTNNSWGGGAQSQALADAIQRAAADNQIFVAAAGNSARDTETEPHYPSSYPNDNIISVAATDAADNLASFSNFGRTSVDLAAPGVSILSTIPNDAYVEKSGTSMASPHVAGAAALLLSTLPGASYATVRDLIFQGVDKVPTLLLKVATGGRLNVANTISSNLTIFGLTVAPDPFSPNADGVADTTTISLSLNKAASWSIHVDGRAFAGTTSGPETVTRQWDGTSDVGVLASDGTYTVYVAATAGLETEKAQGSSTVDTTGPAISGIAAGAITNTAAGITWSTNEASDSNVEYGTAPGNYTASRSSAGLVTSHTIGLTGLTPATTYYYTVSSTDGVGNAAVSPEQSFTTQAGPPPLTVTVAKVSSTKQGKNYTIGLRAAVTDQAAQGVAGASVTLRIGAGGCPVSTAIWTLTGTTDASGNVTLTFKTKNTGGYCASATASKAGFSQGAGSSTFSVP